VEHNGPSSESTFEVEWTAPAEDQDSITFYAAGNAGNLNGSTGGDGSAAAQLKLAADVSSLAEEANDLSLFRISANPVTDNVIYQVPAGEYEIFVYNGAGKLVYNVVHKGTILKWHMSDLTPGVNYVQVLSDKGIYTDKLIVQ
jgi:hypothetical protein